MTDHALINWLLKQQVATQHIDDYMLRYMLWKKHDPTKREYRLHHILRSDEGRHLHNHPWNYLTIILRGGYFEVTLASPREIREWSVMHGSHDLFYENGIYYKQTWKGVGSVTYRKASHFHRILIPREATDETWTLFINGPKIQEWGFFVPHAQYDGRP